MAEKILPHNNEIEEELLGSLIVEPSLMNEVVLDLKPEEFFSPVNQEIYKALRELFFSNKAIEISTVTDVLKRHNTYTSVGGDVTLERIISSSPAFPNPVDYSKIIKEDYLARQLIKVAREIEEDGLINKEDINTQIENAGNKIFNLSQSQKDKNELIPVNDIVLKTLENIQKANNQAGALTGISTGFEELDYMTSGLQDSELIIIAARPSMGKTALALNIATHAALKDNKKVLIFSLEMSKESLVQRMILSEALVDSNKVRTGTLDAQEDLVPIVLVGDQLSQASIYINDKPGLSLSELSALCRRQKLKEPVDLIIIDYMQLMTGTKRAESRQHEISEISRGLKQIAREMECPVICLSQLARGPENRMDKRPILSDLRDSGSIEQDADVVMFLYRDAYYHKDDDDINPYIAELNVAKQRNGPTGVIDLRWVAQYTKFQNPSDFEEEN